MGQQDEAGRVAVAARRAGGTPRASDARDLDPRVASVSTPLEVAEGGIERLCIERGLKMTGQRRTIARVLSEATDHPDVEELYRRAVFLDPRISIATVYRTVRLLEEKGILQRRDFGSGRARYEPTGHGPHYHIIDSETGKVIEFRNLEHERLVRALVEQLGFEVLSLRLEVFAKPLHGKSSP
jgi:Fur family ferric uptake transcriptional regulator